VRKAIACSSVSALRSSRAKSPLIGLQRSQAFGRLPRKAGSLPGPVLDGQVGCPDVQEGDLCGGRHVARPVGATDNGLDRPPIPTGEALTGKGQPIMLEVRPSPRAEAEKQGPLPVLGRCDSMFRSPSARAANSGRGSVRQAATRHPGPAPNPGLETAPEAVLACGERSRCNRGACRRWEGRRFSFGRGVPAAGRDGLRLGSNAV
jgi:hypothetical protein